MIFNPLRLNLLHHRHPSQATTFFNRGNQINHQVVNKVKPRIINKTIGLIFRTQRKESQIRTKHFILLLKIEKIKIAKTMFITSIKV